MQASVVEAVISFSALENTKDLTCVSLVSVCLDDINLQFSSSQQSNKSVQIIRRPPKIPGKQKKSRKGKNRQAVEILAQPVYIERSVKQREENMMSLSIGKSHGQIRRLKNESTLLQSADITAIPAHRSKVLFSFQRTDRNDEGSSAALQFHNERMGFIMLEAGLEKVALKAVKRKGFGSAAVKKESELPTAEEKGEPPVNEAKEYDNASLGNASSSDNVSSPSTTINAETGRNVSSQLDLNEEQSPNAEEKQEKSSSNISSPKKQNDYDVESNGYPGDSEQSHGSKSDLEKEEMHDDDHKESVQKKHDIGPAAREQSLPHQNDDVKSSECVHVKSRKKDITSFSGDIKSVWFNFAAPPHTPISRKIDYTRLDWNLLSTASPSINAWMNPSDRLTVAISTFLHISETRRLAVIASIMADALDFPSIHVPDKPRYWKVQPVSQTLQEDPSCQLCNVLRRYLLLPEKLEALENNLSPVYLPKLATLRQAVIVLSRQWKNVLYIPSLLERTVRPHVYFKLPDHDLGAKAPVSRSTSVNITSSGGPSSPSSVVRLQRQQSSDRSAVTSPNMRPGDSVCNNSLPGDEGNTLSSNSTPLPPKPALPSYPPTSSRASVDVPIRSPRTAIPFQFFKLSSVTPNLPFFKTKSPPPPAQAKIPPPRPPPARRVGLPQQSGEAGPLLSSKLDNPQSVSTSDEDQDGKISEVSPFVDDKNYDLYTWMANQENYKKQNSNVQFPTDDFITPILSEDANSCHKHHSEAAALSTECADSPQDASQPDQFLAAHEIFAPLLASIGVQTQQAPARALQQLGPNVCVLANVEALRVHIAESEPSAPYGTSSSKSSHDVSAFLIERAGVDLDVSKRAGWSGPALFVSRSALRRHTSTVIHFNLNIIQVSQQVNMPLLRLLRQISSMYKNAKQTQQGLRNQRPSVKHGRKLSTSTDYQPTHFSSNFPQPCSSSISEEHEQATLSSIGGEKTSDPRDSVGSSISLHNAHTMAGLTTITTSSSVVAPPGPPSTSSNVSSSRPARPPSFALRFRPANKLSRGYRNFGQDKTTHSPLLGSGIDTATPTLPSDKYPLLVTTEGPQSPTSPDAAPSTPRCWRNIYCLLELYTTTPETKTLSHAATSRRRYDKDGLKHDNDSDLAGNAEGERVPLVADRAQGLGEKERTPIIVMGVAKIHSTQLLASLSGLKLDAKMTGIQSSLSYKEKVRDDNKSTELSVTGQVNSTNIKLLEGRPQQTVVEVKIARSQALYNSFCRKSKDRNTALVSIGDIEVKIPQHPVVLHGMMTRGTKELSTTLQELGVARPAPRLSRTATVDDPDASPRPHFQPPEEPPPQQVPPDHMVSPPKESLLHPLVVQFTLVLQSVCVQAALLPSLQAQYRMEQLRCRGVTGSKAKFTAQLRTHRLSFSTKLKDLPGDSHLPSEACIELPHVQVKAEYIQKEIAQMQHSHNNIDVDSTKEEGVVVRQGGYLNGVAEVGVLEHSLTTDLLNHLVFVQKVFMRVSSFMFRIIQ